MSMYHQPPGMVTFTYHPAPPVSYEATETVPEAEARMRVPRPMARSMPSWNELPRGPNPDEQYPPATGRSHFTFGPAVGFDAPPVVLPGQ
jgi:hypothetical protein